MEAVAFRQRADELDDARRIQRRAGNIHAEAQLLVIAAAEHAGGAVQHPAVDDADHAVAMRDRQEAGGRDFLAIDAQAQQHLEEMLVVAVRQVMDALCVQFEAARVQRRLQLRNLADLKVPFQDRKSTRLNSSHVKISYAVFCLKKKKKKQ